MTAVTARHTAFRRAAFAVAVVSQLQGTVSGPLTLRPIAGYKSILGAHLGGISGSETVADQGGYRAILGSFLGGVSSAGGETAVVPSGRHAGDHQPNPRGAPFPTSLRTFIQIATKPPSVQLRSGDWRNPLRAADGSRRGFDSGTPLVLLPSVFPDGRHAGDDQPNPRGPVVPLAASGFTHSGALSLLEQTTYVARAPLITRIWPRPMPQDGPPQSLIQFTLSGPPPVPDGRRASLDQPNPRGYAFQVGLRMGVVNTPRALINSPVPDGRHAGDDQPNPRGPVVPLAARGQVSSTPAGLIEEAQPDATYVTRNPLITRIWHRPPPQHFQRNLLQTTLKDQDARPYTAGWGNPLTAVYPVSLRTIARNTPVLYEVQEEIPVGTNYDQPNPVIVPASQRFRMWALNLLQSTLIPAPEVPPVGVRSGNDQPNPFRDDVRVNLVTWTQNLLQSTLTPEEEPGLVYEVDLEVVRFVEIDLLINRAVDVDLDVATAVEIDLKVL